LQTCLYKNLGAFPDKVFSYHAFRGCYDGFPDSIYVDGRLEEATCPFSYENTSYSVPGFKIDTLCLAFDWKDAIIQNLVRSSFQNEVVYEKWERCCQNAINCCNEMVNLYNSNEKIVDNCPAVWDGWTCFEPTLAGQKVKKTCPSYAYNEKQPSCDCELFKNLKAFI
jgi:hypothetical protein